MTIPYFKELISVKNPKAINLETTLENIKISLDKKIIIVGDLRLRIEFYPQTWEFERSEGIDIWNKCCGSLRGKRYKNFYKQPTIEEKMNYLLNVIKIKEAYLILDGRI